eukprot:TRINITY_DN1841_c0_g1_i1.p1 TRINITY_DN1841_c0_g1~~TRINITY_DN1841_c0_g1_i1.p1  ORF type:complete len:205 (-),score=30.85 TRINITY_DN1841_c0_g1_i1:205-819(-)
MHFSADVAPGRNYMNQQWHLYLLWNYLRSAEDSEDVRVVRAFACDRGVALTSFPLHPQQWWSEEPQAKRGGHVCVETNCRRTFEHDFVSSWATEVIVCCSILCNHPQFPQWCEAIRARCMQQGALPRGIVDRNSDETPWNCTLLLALRLLGSVAGVPEAAEAAELLRAELSEKRMARMTAGRDVHHSAPESWVTWYWTFCCTAL